MMWQSNRATSKSVDDLTCPQGTLAGAQCRYAVPDRTDDVLDQFVRDVFGILEIFFQRVVGVGDTNFSDVQNGKPYCRVFA